MEAGGLVGWRGAWPAARCASIANGPRHGALFPFPMGTSRSPARDTGRYSPGLMPFLFRKAGPNPVTGRNTEKRENGNPRQQDDLLAGHGLFESGPRRPSGAGLRFDRAIRRWNRARCPAGERLSSWRGPETSWVVHDLLGIKADAQIPFTVSESGPHLKKITCRHHDVCASALFAHRVQALIDWNSLLTVGVAQLGRAPDCGSGGRGFESLRPPQFVLVFYQLALLPRQPLCPN
jgi:hypothetical protein